MHANKSMLLRTLNPAMQFRQCFQPSNSGRYDHWGNGLSNCRPRFFGKLCCRSHSLTARHLQFGCHQSRLRRRAGMNQTRRNISLGLWWRRQ
jgi:hypothetical protein